MSIHDHLIMNSQRPFLSPEARSLSPTSTSYSVSYSDSRSSKGEFHSIPPGWLQRFSSSRNISSRGSSRNQEGSLNKWEDVFKGGPQASFVSLQQSSHDLFFEFRDLCGMHEPIRACRSAVDHLQPRLPCYGHSANVSHTLTRNFCK